MDKQELSYLDTVDKVDNMFLDPDFTPGLERMLIPVILEDDSPTSFAAYYRYMTGTTLPRHCRRWIDTIYEGKSEDMGVLTFAFRGSWKTTTISILYTSYRIGKEPWKTNLILQNNDQSAQNTSLAVANIIELDPKWRDVFPNVIPDKRNGWGAQGYWVRDTDIPDSEWARLTAVTRDPTLLGLGISSGSVIGRHPTGVLLLDDIHDEKNSVSELERSKVVKILTDTIMPMIVPDGTKPEGEQLETWTLAVGTPWHEDDAYHYMRDTGEFKFCFTPLLFPVDEDARGAVWFEHKKLVGYYRLGWPERCPPEVVISFYNLAGHRGFGRMYLLSLAASNELGVPFYSVPEKEIPDGPIWGGVDYASVVEIRGKVMDPSKRSLFALFWGTLTPQNNLVIIDGIVGHYSQTQSENHVHTLQQRYLGRYQQTGIEMDGKGEEFFAILSRDGNPHLYPFWVRGMGRKPDRLEKFLMPWIEMGRIRISDADTQALNLLRKSLDEFPNGNLDVLDAVFAVYKCLAHVFTKQVDSTQSSLSAHAKYSRQNTNPFAKANRR